MLIRYVAKASFVVKHQQVENAKVGKQFKNKCLNSFLFFCFFVHNPFVILNAFGHFAYTQTSFVVSTRLTLDTRDNSRSENSFRKTYLRTAITQFYSLLNI